MKLFYVLLSAGMIGALWCLFDLLACAVDIAERYRQNKDTEDL